MTVSNQVVEVLREAIFAYDRTLMTWLPAIVTMIALSKMAAGIGLDWGVSSAVSVVQTFIVRHHRPTAAY